MAKIVKGLVAVGMIVAGVVTMNPTLILQGASIGATLLMKPKATELGTSNLDRLNLSINPQASRVMVFGRTAMGTDLMDQEITGADKEFLHRFVVCAGHKVNSIQQIWFDDELAWTSAGGVQGRFVDYLAVDPKLEGTPANVVNLGARMGASRRYTGCAYVYFRFRLTGLSKKTESPFASQVPTRITIIGEGVPCYDPRQDSTRGGSGPMRANDQTTWTYGTHARNPACQLATRLLGWKIQNPQSGTWKLSVGMGVPPDRIDWASFIEGANLCDETVALAAGGTEPRYRGDGVFTEADDPGEVVDAFKATMNADLDDQDGLFRLTVFHNDLAMPVAHFTEADIQGDYVWLQTPDLNTSYNVVRGSWIDPSDKSLYQPAPYPEVRVASPDGLDRVHQASFGLSQSRSQAVRLAKQRLQRQLYGGTFRATFLATGWRVQKNSVITLSFAPEGFATKLFRVVETEVAQNGLVPMVLREEHPAIYAWDAEEGPAVTIAEPTLYAAGDAPIAQMLATVEEGATANVGRGSYSAGATYNPGDMVLWAVADGGDGGGYVRIGTGPTTGVAPSNATWWKALVERGDTGPAGTSGAAAVEATLQPPAMQVKSYANGGITDWAGVVTTVRVLQGTTDVAASFTLSIVANPQGLNTTIDNGAKTVTVFNAGTGAGEFGNEAVDKASLTIRATGGGAYAGITRDMVLSLTKLKGGYEIVSTLPTTNLFEGRMVYRTTDDKLYRYTGSGWSSATDATDIVGQLATAQIGDNVITAAKIGAREVVASKLAVTDFENLAVNGSLQTGTLDGWNRLVVNSGSSIVVSTDPTNWPSEYAIQFYRHPSDSGELSIVNGTANWDTSGYNDGIQLEPGEELYVEATMWCSTAGVAFGFDVVAKAVGGGVATIVCEAIQNCYIGGTTQVWYNGGPVFSNVAFAAKNTTGARQRVFVRVNGPVTGGEAGYLWNLKIRRRNNAKLIVDGSISAQKIAAGAIVAGKIAADAVEAINIKAGTIVASKFVTDQGVDLAALVPGQFNSSAAASGSISLTENQTVSFAQTSAMTVGTNDYITIRTSVTITGGTTDGSNIVRLIRVRNGTETTISSVCAPANGSAGTVTINHEDTSHGGGSVYYILRATTGINDFYDPSMYGSGSLTVRKFFIK